MSECVEALRLLFESLVDEFLDGLESLLLDGSFELMERDESLEIVDDGVVVVEWNDVVCV